MKPDIYMIILTLSVVFGIQFFILLVHYLEIRSEENRYFFWWVLGTLFNFLYLVISLFRGNTLFGEFMILISNTFVVLALWLIYVGMKKFFESYRFNKRCLYSFGIYLLVYSYYTFAENNIKMRSIIISFVIGVIAFMIAKLLYEKNTDRVYSIKMTFYIFLFNSVFFTLRGFYMMYLNNIEIFVYSKEQVALYAIFLFSGVVSAFSFILMQNHRLNARIKEDNKNLGTIFNTNLDCMVITDKSSGKILRMNQYFLTLFNYESREVLGKTTTELGIWEDLGEREEFLEILDKAGTVENYEVELNKKTKDKLTVLMSSNIITLDGDECLITVLKDITRRKMMEKEIVEKEKFLYSIINNSGAVIYVKDLEGKYKLVNNKWLELTGFSRKNVLGKSDDELFPKETASQHRKGEVEVIANNSIVELEDNFIYKRKRKHFITIKFPIKDKDNKTAGVCGMSTEITKRKDAEEKIRQLIKQLEIEKNSAQINSITDSLTGLYNRRYFDEILKKEFYRIKRDNTSLAMIILDIDHYKKYNDTYGHLEGDKCLKKVAGILKHSVKRKTDTVSRYGGEEFSVILPEVNLEWALKVAENIRKNILNEQIVHESSPVAPYLTVSLGVISVMGDEISSQEEIISLADTALYFAKERGRNRTEFERITPKETIRNTLLKLVWNEKDECGNEIIDEQHIELFKLSNEIIDNIKNDFNQNHCLKLMETTISKLEKHFEDEEAIIEKTEFPYINEHKEIHKELLEKSKLFYELYKEDELDVEELMSYMTYDVVYDHLGLEDKLFFPYLIED